MSSEEAATTAESAESAENSAISDETRALEEVINAFNYYGTYGKDKILAMIKQMRNIPQEHQILIGGNFKEHINSLKQKMEHNHQMLKTMLNYGAGMFGEESARALRIHQSRRPSGDFQSKVLSTLRQIAREWSDEGRPEREATFRPILDELERLHPRATARRHEIRVLVPGCGLGRLAHDLIDEGFTVQGNEFSFFMLLPSCFILNACRVPDQHTIYPFLFDKSNAWAYADQLRPVSFPDKSPAASAHPTTRRLNSFSMCAGDFLDIVRGAHFDVIVTAWFLDTAHNVIDYIDAIHAALPPNGVWINVGPLTWHYEDVRDEVSIELPYEEIMRLVRRKPFHILNERRIESRYTVNRTSMLHNVFTCAYFCAQKKIE